MVLELQMLKTQNAQLETVISTIESKYRALQMILHYKGYDSDFDFGEKPTLVVRLLLQILKNAGRKPNGFRHDDEVIEHFAVVCFILGGPRMYEILCSNSEGSLPNARTVQRTLNDCAVPADSDDVHVALLKNYLTDNRLPMVVALAEDATAVIAKREYNARSNSVTGIALPLKSNGLPDLKSGIVRTATDICKAMDHNNRATVVIAVTAQPLVDGSPSFRLATFPSDNRFKAKHVNARWDTLVEKLNAAGIKVSSIAGDGDSRILSTQKRRMRLFVELTPQG